MAALRALRCMQIYLLKRWLHCTRYATCVRTQPLFKNVDMDKQGAKLMKILGVAVLNLDKMDTFRPTLERLGKKVGAPVPP